jgi:hypothetical protein
MGRLLSQTPHPGLALLASAFSQREKVSHGGASDAWRGPHAVPRPRTPDERTAGQASRDTRSSRPSPHGGRGSAHPPIPKNSPAGVLSAPTVSRRGASGRPGTGLLSVALGLLLLAAGAQAGQAPQSQTPQGQDDYELASALLSRDSARFPTQDLVSRLADRLEQNAAAGGGGGGRQEALLIRAAQRCRRAQSSPPEEAVALRAEADRFFSTFLAAGQAHRLYAEARQQARANQWELARKVLDLPAAARNTAVRDEALRGLQQWAEQTRVENEALRRELDARYDVVNRCSEREVPARLLQALERALEAYVPQDQKYIQACLSLIECVPDKPAEQKRLAQALAGYCQRQLDAEAIGYSVVALAWYHFAKGKVHAVVKEEKEAEEDFRSVEDLLAGGGRHPLEEQILKATHCEWIRLKVELGQLEPALTMLERLRSLPEGSVLREHAGRLLQLDVARGLAGQAESGAEECEQAAKILKGLLDQDAAMAPTVLPALAEVTAQARTKGLRLRLAPAVWQAAGRGFQQRANETYEQLRRAGPAAEQRGPLLARLRTELAPAIECQRAAIREARRAGTLARLTLEPDAWAEIAHCYLKGENFAEAMIACQSLLDACSPPARARWLPDAEKEKAFYAKPEVRAVLTRLDQPNGLLDAARRQMQWAYAQHGARVTQNLLPRPLVTNEDRILEEGRAACEAATRHQTQAQVLLGEK